jgi:hypothetical protein
MKNVIRSVEDPIKAFEHMVELFSVQEFLACCSVSVPELEHAWSTKKGIAEPATAANAGVRCGLPMPPAGPGALRTG